VFTIFPKASAPFPGAKPHEEKTSGDNLGRRLILFVVSTGYQLIKYDSDHVMKKNNIFLGHSSPLTIAEGYILAKTPDDFTH
jgi:hypothetical protein